MELGKLLGEVTFTCSRLSAEWAAMSDKQDPFVVIPMNELPSELSGGSDEQVEEERQKIRDRILHKTNEEIVSEDESRPQVSNTHLIFTSVAFRARERLFCQCKTCNDRPLSFCSHQHLLIGR